MIAVLVVAVMVLASTVAVVRAVLLDRPSDPPRSRAVDPDFLPPARRTC